MSEKRLTRREESARRRREADKAIRAAIRDKLPGKALIFIEPDETGVLGWTVRIGEPYNVSFWVSKVEALAFDRPPGEVFAKTMARLFSKRLEETLDE